VRSVILGRVGSHWVTMNQAASWWDVGYPAVNKWHNDEVLTIFHEEPEMKGELCATEADVRAAKVIPRSDICRLAEVPPGVLSNAERDGLVTPSAGERLSGRFSLDDREILRAIHAGTYQANHVPAVPAPRARTSTAGTVDDRWSCYKAYASGELTPAQLPDWFWDLDQCPRFIARYDTWWHTLGEPKYEDGSLVGYWVKRSEGWKPYLGRPGPDGKTMYSYAAADDHDHYFPLDKVDDFDIWHGNMNLVWQLARDEWDAEWRRRRKKTKH
jgi:hypothetical protein